MQAPTSIWVIVDGVSEFLGKIFFKTLARIGGIKTMRSINEINSQYNKN